MDFPRLLLDSTSEGLWSIDLDGLITFVNAAAVRMFGYKDANDLLGQHSHELVHHSHPDGSHYPRAECPIYQAFIQGQPRHLTDEVLWRKDGSHFFADYSSVPLFDGGKIIGAVVTFKDNSATRDIQQQLNLHRAWLTATLKGIGDAVITTDANQPPRVTFLNPIAETLTGWTQAQALGKPVLDVFNIIHQVTRAPAVNPIDRVLREGVVVGLANHTVLISRDGTEYIIEDSAAPIKRDDDSIQGVVLVFRDATAHHLLQLETQAANRRTEIERAKREVLFEETPFPLALLEGPEHLVVFANSSFSQTLFGGLELTGRTVAAAVPEAVGQGFVALLDEVYSTGRPYVGTETPVELRQPGGTSRQFYLNFVYKPIRDSSGQIEGILIGATDVTEMVAARNRIKESEAHFRDLVDASPAMIWITDENSKCTYLSRQWYEFTGRTPEQDLGVGWLENIHPEDLPETGRVYTQAVNDKGRLLVDYRLRQKSGAYRWCVDIGHPRFDHAGQFIGYIGTVTDIHERLIAERGLKEAQERFERSARATDLGVWYCDLPFDKLNWNTEVKRHFFLPPDAEVTIDTFYARMHPDDREPTRRAIQTAIDQQTPYDTVFRTMPGAASVGLKSIRAVGWADFNAAGQPIRFDGITLDVTDHLKMQEDLRCAKDAAEAANAAKSAFLANMSHEIRTPLGAILGFTDLLKDQDLTEPDRAQFLDTISRNGRALTRIIDDILDLAKVESGKLEIESLEFSFTELMDEVLNLFRERARTKGIYLRLTRADDVPDRILADPTRLRQILINIIGNAIKFTRVGGVSVDVKIKPRPEGKLTFTIATKDTGVGIPAEQHGRLFQPFTQADNTTTRKFGGTGLGLVLSHRLATALGGGITIENCDEGVGSTFVVNFVAEVPRAPRDHARRTVPTRTGEATLPLAGLSILLADDSVDNQFLAKLVLTRLGASVDVAGNGLEAFRLGINGGHDVVLMDIQMPEMDGYQATRSLREAGFRKPIIALTAHAMAEEKARTRAAGCDGHLTKPLVQAEIIETIRRHVRPGE